MSRRYSIYFMGEPERGEFSLCSGDYCTGPMPWNSTSDMVAGAVKALGITVVSHGGGPLPTAVEIEAETEDLTADEAHSLSGDSEAYFGGALISVIVSNEE